MFFLLYFSCSHFTFAHRVPVHERITLNAVASATQSSSGYNEFMATIGGPTPLSVNGGPAKSPALWLVEGSAREDDNDNKTGGRGGYRSLNHFYDPLAGAGLTDWPIKGQSGPLGQDSFFWASTLKAPGRDVFLNKGTINDWSWKDARNYEFLGMTESTKTARERNLAQMFQALGEVMHLLQDASQPQHVRNEQHLDESLLRLFYESPIEKYGEKYVATLNYSHGMLDWRAAGFTKLRDFWDRDKYTWDRSNPTARNAQPLINDQDKTMPTEKLGLAEFVNGVLAFISGSTFQALNVPLAVGANTIMATAVDLAGNTAAATITVTGQNGGGGTQIDPVQLTATPIGGFAPLTVTLTPANGGAPGTVQQVLYDFDGDGIIDDSTHTDFTPVSHTYSSAGQYFPVVTVVTSAGRFSSIGGWNAPDANRLRINVQAPPQLVGNAIAVTDPVDLKAVGGNLYVLSRQGATVTEFDANGSSIRSLNNIGGSGSRPTGLDADAAGNVYVALNDTHRVVKLAPSGASFVVDTSFGTSGYLGDGSPGSGNGQFNLPFDVALTPDAQEIAVSDSGNHRIQRFKAADGSFVAAFGQQGSGAGQFNTPKGLTYDQLGTLYIVDSANNRVVLTDGSAFLGTSGSPGTALGQFQGAVNLSVGSAGIYVADAGNNRVQAFDALASAQSPPFNPRLALANQFSPVLSQPYAVSAVSDLTQEKLYIADTGNNRVLLVQLPSDTPEAVWNAMKQRLLAGDIAGAIPYYHSTVAEDYRQTDLSIGTTALIPVISQIPAISPIYIEGGEAQYYFQQVIDGLTITFPIDFVKENGTWKIMEY